jgi:hypothetical protein
MSYNRLALSLFDSSRSSSGVIPFESVPLMSSSGSSKLDPEFALSLGMIQSNDDEEDEDSFLFLSAFFEAKAAADEDPVVE